MLAYDVMETGFKVGFIEFVGNSEVFAGIHKRIGIFKGPLDKRSVYDYFDKEIKVK